MARPGHDAFATAIALENIGLSIVKEKCHLTYFRHFSERCFHLALFTDCKFANCYHNIIQNYT